MKAFLRIFCVKLFEMIVCIIFPSSSCMGQCTQ